MSGRKFDMSLDINAPIEDVWRALTDAGELTRWFSTNAAITLEPGGTYQLSWGGEWEWTMEVDRVEAPTRLRLVDRQARPFDVNGQPLETAQPVEVVLEYFLEAHGNRTTLRLVHSGFGSGASWDEEFDGISHGWPIEMRILRHYLQRHAGRDRQHAWARVGTDVPADRLWKTLTSAHGFVTSGSVEGLHDGDPVHLELATGDVIAGSVLGALPGHHLAIAAKNMGDAVLDLQVHEAGGKSMAGVVLSSWTMPASEVAAFHQRAQAALERMNGAAGL
jgi:uncharacterized protein YndB with AHSA1/START domain